MDTRISVPKATLALPHLQPPSRTFLLTRHLPVFVPLSLRVHCGWLSRRQSAPITVPHEGASRGTLVAFEPRATRPGLCPGDRHGDPRQKGCRAEAGMGEEGEDGEAQVRESQGGEGPQTAGRGHQGQGGAPGCGRYRSGEGDREGGRSGVSGGGGRGPRGRGVGLHAPAAHRKPNRTNLLG